MPFPSFQTPPAQRKLKPAGDSVAGELVHGPQRLAGTPSFQGLKPEVGQLQDRFWSSEVGSSQPADPTPGLQPLQLLTVR